MTKEQKKSRRSSMAIKHKLTAEQRMVLQTILPQKSNEVLTIRVKRELRKMISFTDAELLALGFKKGENRPVNPATLPKMPVEFEFSAVKAGIIEDALLNLIAAGDFGEEHLDLYDIFHLGKTVEIEEDTKSA